ncbi:hypothetical protein GJAV_G00131130 [Gymnothorax javanicus]|nr:hypothetical protein GJAV_G00131130 [Gymnothorax javanicus]
MSRYPFLFLLLVFGSGILSAVVSGTTDLTSTARVALGTTNPAPVPADPTSAPTPKRTTAASNGTTVSPAGPTTSARNATTAATTVPTNGTTVAPPLTTSASNATTAPPPAPTNATTAPPPAPTNATTAPPPVPTNATTAPPPVPTNGTTVAPPPTTSASNTTTAPPTVPTNATTVAPPVSPTAGSNATTAPTPTTTATPTTVPPPTVGNYNVSNGANGTACLMATMGLRIGYNDGKTVKSINLDPSATVATGKCGAEESDHSLDLSFENSSIAFLFSVDAGKFRLHGVNVTLVVGTAGTFSAANANLSLWEASVGSSYMCRRDQAYNITDTLVLYTWGLQVQPYRVQNNRFATADDCPADADESFIVPLIVGVSLGALTLIVLVAYLVGRSRSQMNGYQAL